MPKLATQKITKRFLDGLQPDVTKDVQFMDSEVRGFGVRLKPSGSAAFFIRYKLTDGSERRYVLGKVGTITPDEARTLAKAKLADVAKGGDPSAERHAVREAMTVAEICDWYISAATTGNILGRRGARIKASTLAMDKSRIETHVKPLIGKKTADGLTDTDIARLQRDIASGKTAKARKGRGGATTGGSGVAARTVRMLGAILEHAKRAKLVKSNPAQGVRLLAEGTNDRRLSEEEIIALGKAMQATENEQNPVALAAVRFLLLTGFRRMEALSLRWDEVDLKGRCISLSDSKSGSQVRAIGAVALAVLEAARADARSEWVFPASRGDGHFIGLPRVLERLCAAASIEGVSLHTLRHSFASVAADEGFSELTVAALLGHARRGVTQRYVKVDRAAVLAADAVSAKIAGLLVGQAAEADVVRLRRA